MPPKETEFWALFDYFWDNGLGHRLEANGDPVAWTAPVLESALENAVDVRSIENWRSRRFIPTRENIRKLCWVISDGDNVIRQAWSEALIAAWRVEKRKNRDEANRTSLPLEKQDDAVKINLSRKTVLIVAAALGALAFVLIGWFALSSADVPSVSKIRICDQYYFNRAAKTCTKHVPVFVQGLEEVFLSFDFQNVPEGMPFERWWIHNGERVAGRTSFNDAAWPGYTFWRPEGGLLIGQYVVRIVVDGRVFTQTFYVQREGFNARTGN